MKNTHESLFVLTRFFGLKADYLRQADALEPTATHLSDWLRSVHRLAQRPVEPEAIGLEMPRQLYSLPLFRHYVLNCLCGTEWDFIRSRLSADELVTFKRFNAPAVEQSALTLEFRNRVYHAMKTFYQDCLHHERTEKYAAEKAYTHLCGPLSPDDALLFVTICHLPGADTSTDTFSLVDKMGQPQTLELHLFPPATTFMRPAEKVV